MRAEADASDSRHIAEELTVRLIDARQNYWKLRRENQELRKRLGLAPDEAVLPSGTH